jgi:hypothetical protein
MILDTVVLIDLEREITRGKVGPATVALKRFADHELFLTPTIGGELAAGKAMRNHEIWSRFIEPFTLLTINSEVCWKYGGNFTGRYGQKAQWSALKIYGSPLPLWLTMKAS